MSEYILNLIKSAETNHKLQKEELEAILNDTDCNDKLFEAANRVREKYVGNDVQLRGLIEFSNICKRNCLYCGLRASNNNIERYRLTEEQIIETAKRAANLGYKTVVLQSGEDDYFTLDKLKHIVSEIKKFDIAVTLSIGEKTYEEYKAYKEVGADRYLLRIETTDKALYEELDPLMSHENRKRCLYDLKSIGYETGTGCMVGLPGQTMKSLAEDILFFKEIDADMVGIGPFIPNEDTPLKDEAGGDFFLSLKVMALTRLLLPDINIPATTAMESLHPNGRLIALNSGANVAMPNVTEGEARKLYLLYPGKICTGDTPSTCRQCITKKINSIGRDVSTNYGFRK